MTSIQRTETKVSNLKQLDIIRQEKRRPTLQRESPFEKPLSHALQKAPTECFLQIPFYHKTVLFALVLFFMLKNRMVIL